MMDTKPTPPAQLKYRQQPPPSEAELIAEMRELVQYSEERRGFVWVKIRGHVPHKLIGSVAGGESGRGYLTMNLLHHKFLVHRLVWLWHHGAWPDGMLDHMNGDRKDNRIGNLRLVTTAQNVWNRVKSSGELGAGVQCNSAGNFNARIQVAIGERVYLGTYKTRAEAEAAYIGAATVLHGDFAAHKRKMRPDSSPQLYSQCGKLR